MFFVPIGRFSVKGGRNITLNTGERLLIGQPHLYENEFREAITENRKFHTETTIRNIERLSHIGVKTLVDLYEEVFGRIGYIMMPSGVVELILRRVRNGQLLALVLPPATRADCVADSKQLENLSGGLVGASAVNPEIADSDDVTFNDLKGMEDKLIYVLKRAPHFITSAKVKKALRKGLSEAAIISVVVVLVAWAASHFFGVGFAIDAILLAIGFVMIGWAIFGAMKKLLKCLKLVKNAESLSDLDKAAEMMADAIVALGVETLIGLLTRGAGRMKAKSSGGSGAGAGNGKPRTQKDIEADNKAKADAARAKSDYEVHPDVKSPKVGDKIYKRVHKDGDPDDRYTLQKDGKPMGANEGKVPTHQKGLKDLPDNYTQKRDEGWPELDYEYAPGKRATDYANFSDIEAVNLDPGTKIYRIVDEKAADGGAYWAYELPKNKTDWRSDYAVKDGWNDNGYYVEHVVGDDGLKAWSGKAAGQVYQGDKFHLSGQGEQLFVTPGAIDTTPPKLTNWPEG